MDDEKLVEKAAREIIDRHGAEALPILRERALRADDNQDEVASRTWKEIADAAERILREGTG